MLSFNFSRRTIVIQDEELKQKLNSGSCDIINNISFPHSPSVSFVNITPNLTLYRCSFRAVSTDLMIEDTFGSFL